jgi:hypothetical protein
VTLDFDHTPQAHGSIVNRLQQAVIHGDGNLASVPLNVRQVITSGAWTDYITVTNERARFDTFAAFCEKPRPWGLGTDIATLKRFCNHDETALNAIDEVTRQGHGGDRRSEAFKAGNARLETGPNKNTRQHAIRHLRDKRPDLHAKVLAGELTPHRAMVLAGLRRPTMTVPADDLEAAMRALLRRYGVQQMEACVSGRRIIVQE